MVRSPVLLLLILSAPLLCAEPTGPDSNARTGPRVRTSLEEDLEAFLLTTYRHDYIRTHEVAGETLIDSMRETRYPSSVLAFIYYLKEDDRINAVDVYNYLYAVARVGIDCVGLVYK